ncbi:MAG: MSMEG_4193 family putative phosphomutase [Actinobacteria bacterium]|nr:MSMEG_4193 family putative phosphomutase [Actinomycetota bacterium]
MKKKKSKPIASTVVILVRHGKTPSTDKLLPGRAAGLHLSQDGQNEALEVARRLGKLKNVGAIYASPLERARATAAPIAKVLKKRIVIEKGLLECDFGDWTGKELGKLMKLPEWSTVQRAPSTFRFPNGESFTEMQTRMVTTLDKLRKAHAGKVVICVSHADPIKAAVAHAMGTHLDLFQRVVISTCSVSAISYSNHGPIVLTVNSTGGGLSELKIS